MSLRPSSFFFLGLFCVAGETNGNCGIGNGDDGGGMKEGDVVPMPHPPTALHPATQLLTPSLPFAYLRATCDPVATIVVAVPSLASPLLAKIAAFPVRATPL